MDTFLLHDASQLSLHLKSLRKSRAMTQAEMARRLHVTQERYSQIERHPELIATGRLLEIFAILRVDVLLRLRPDDVDTKALTAAPANRGVDW